MTERPRCMALTAKGDQCTNRAKNGGDYCGAHSGNAGRPTKLTRALVTAVDATIRTGAFWEEAAVSLGIGRATLYAWREKGEADLEAGKATLHAEFADTLMRASAATEQAAAEAITNAFSDDWRAAAWYLERRNPARWGKRVELEHSGSIAGEPTVFVPESEERRRRILAVLNEGGIVGSDE